MKDDWREMTIDQLGTIVTGKTPSSRVAGCFGSEIPFVTPSDFDGRRLIDSTARYLTAKGAAIVGNCRVPAGAVMVSCIGSDMGKAAVAARDCVTNQQINSIVVADDADALFVYYNLRGRKAEIQSAAGGSAQPILNKSAFGQLPIELPTPPEQRGISRILGALDEKIELNRRMNETLEAIAQAFFKSWFVDFDAVRAKMEGRWRRGESLPGLPAGLYELFPDSFADSSIGRVPKGWDIKPLDQIATFLNGLALQNFPADDKGSLPVIKIAQLHDGNTEGADLASCDLPPQYIVDDGDILFSWSGSLEVVIWTGGRGALNQHLFRVTSAEYPNWFVFQWLKEHLRNFQAIAAGKATTMGHIQRHHLSEAMLPVPPSGLMAAANKVIEPLMRLAISNSLQSKTLAAILDALLPKLISGEIRLNVAETIVKKAV